MGGVNALLLILHVALAATTLGIALGASGTLKRARALGSAALIAAARDFRRRDLVATIAGLLVLATGVGLIMMTPGGFKGLPPEYHAAMALVLGMNALGLFFMRPLAKRLVAAAEAEDGVTADGLVRKVAMGSGILQLLWLVTLVLMFMHRF